ncbi:MAG: glutamate-5-semialdehyde dehydrogenase, partial [Muribaculaceae bacterium]|nr:glutamate-5-semialdehyde dehydrogenase [Muribaculaceae bacterium]
MENFNEIFAGVKAASRALLTIDDTRRSLAITDLADRVEANIDRLLGANAADLARMDPANPLYDRLQLTPTRLAAIASDLRHVASLPCPVGEEVEHRTLPNGIDLRRVRVPFGVIGVVYEARPNVTFDVFSLCLKSGNACVMKGGHDATDSNLAAIALIRESLAACGISTDTAVLLPSTHEAAAAMLDAVGYIDVCIPRGGRRLIDFVRDRARIPVIETGAGVVQAYFDIDGDLAMGRDIVENAKTRRVSVCNALDTLLIHRGRL